MLSRKLTTEECSRAIGLLEAGLTQTDVTIRLNVSQSVILIGSRKLELLQKDEELEDPE